LAQAKASRADVGQAVFEAGRPLLTDAYAEWDQRDLHERSDAERKHLALLRRFREQLEPEPGKFSLGVFEFYNDNATQLDGLLNDADKQRLINLVTGTVFKWDPIQFDFRFLDTRDGGSSRYTVSSGVGPFGDALKTAKLLSIQTAPFRQKIINFIPFAY